MRATVLEIDKSIFRNNIKLIRKYVSNKEILPVIKANGYGTYINKQLDLINDFNIVGVAIVSEAIELRKIGYKKEILVLNQPSIDDINDILKYNIVIGLSSKEFLDVLIESKKSINVHLEIETGMNRTGIKINELESFIKIIKESNINVEGVYTHLSCADCDKEYTNMQLDTFDKAVSIVKVIFQILNIFILKHQMVY
ncbi:MAG: alanine racemase [Bacilli bacterium]|nr:alanine racemase [Bacilli bacterium]